MLFLVEQPQSQEFLDQSFKVNCSKKLFCDACREVLSCKKSSIETHIKTKKHEKGKERLKQKAVTEMDITQTFLRRMISLSTVVKELHHRIRLNRGFSLIFSGGPASSHHTRLHQLHQMLAVVAILKSVERSASTVGLSEKALALVRPLEEGREGLPPECISHVGLVGHVTIPHPHSTLPQYRY